MTKKSLCKQLLMVLSIALIASSSSAATKDYAVQASALVRTSPPSIKLSWVATTMGTRGYTVSRKTRAATSWTPMATLPSTTLEYTDTTVGVGDAYEYQVSAVQNPGVTGYVYAGKNAPLVESRGKVVLLVDDTMSLPLANELTRLNQDLIGDGWKVLRHDVSRSASVPSVKALIAADYQADPIQVKSVFIFGHVPIPYSGLIAPDGHGDHYGAWPADIYYGDMDGSWTDTTVNSNSASRVENRNIPGDGKFDQSTVNTVELAVGRVDLFRMNNFAKSETELLRQYLNKDHNFRTKVFSFPERGLIRDGFGEFGGEAFAASGFRNFAAMFTSANIDQVASGAFFTKLATEAYLWSYACGGGGYGGATSVGSTIDFANTDTHTVFTMLFGSYFGDWGSENGFLRAPLASASYTLTCVWSGRPHFFMQTMALGETAGEALLTTLNNHNLYHPGYFTPSVHEALMGDPTLRMHTMKPVTALSAAPSGSNTNLSWAASDENVVGYNVYRANTISGTFTKLNASPIVSTAFIDTNAPVTSKIYMVRAVELRISGSGSYYNSSVGSFIAVDGTNAAPTVNAGPDQITLLSQPVALNGTIDDDGKPNPPAATTAAWTKVSGPGTVTFADASKLNTTAAFSALGTYVLNLTGSDGALVASDDVQVIVTDASGNQVPIVDVGPDLNISLPSLANLQGTASDDGLPNPPAKLTYTWSVKGNTTGGVTFADAHALKTTASFPSAGRYTIQLGVYDGQDTSYDELVVSVSTAGSNAAPNVSAGPDQNITLPSVANLLGNASDDGLPSPPATISKTWSKISGPGTVQFSAANALATSATFSADGTYVLRLTVSDSALQSSDDITVNVSPLPPINQAPRVSAGDDKTILITDLFSLAGSASDDGLPTPPGQLTFDWNQINGPGLASFFDAHALSGRVVFPGSGSYTLRLSAYDGGLTSSDDVQITVNDSPVQIPLPSPRIVAENPIANPGKGLRALVHVGVEAAGQTFTIVNRQGEKTRSITVDGNGDLIWDGRNRSGNAAGAGTYAAKNGSHQTIRLLVVN